MEIKKLGERTIMWACLDADGFIFSDSISGRKFTAQLFRANLFNSREMTKEQMKKCSIHKIDMHLRVIK